MPCYLLVNGVNIKNKVIIQLWIVIQNIVGSLKCMLVMYLIVIIQIIKKRQFNSWMKKSILYDDQTTINSYRWSLFKDLSINELYAILYEYNMVWKINFIKIKISFGKYWLEHNKRRNIQNMMVLLIVDLSCMYLSCFIIHSNYTWSNSSPEYERYKLNDKEITFGVNLNLFIDFIKEMQLFDFIIIWFVLVILYINASDCFENERVLVFVFERRHRTASIRFLLMSQKTGVRSWRSRRIPLPFGYLPV